MNGRIKKIHKDMKRLPELCGFAENAQSTKSRILIQSQMLEELDAIKKQVTHLYDA